MSDSSDRKENAQDLEQRAKALFDASVERLDARTRSRLTQARAAAAAEAERAHTRPKWLAPAPTAGLAAAVVLAITIGLWPRAPGPAEAPLALDDFDIVADAENIEMLKDVEFYAWLDDVPEFRDNTG
jgi:negative regulator of sigma E activity